MNDRFQVFKSKNFNGMYAVFDNEEKSIVATADSFREANQIKKDVEIMLFQNQAVDEAMTNLFGK